jgi:hypothetical protein
MKATSIRRLVPINSRSIPINARPIPQALVEAARSSTMRVSLTVLLKDWQINPLLELNL